MAGFVVAAGGVVGELVGPGVVGDVAGPGEVGDVGGEVTGFGVGVGELERARRRVVLWLVASNVVLTVGCARTQDALQVARSPSLPEHAD